MSNPRMKNPLHKSAVAVAALALCIMTLSACFVLDGVAILSGGKDDAVSSEASTEEATKERRKIPLPSSSSEESSTPSDSVPGIPASSREPEEEEPTSPANPDDVWQLILARADNPLPPGYAPPELEKVAGYEVDSRISTALTRMIDDAKQDDVALLPCSGYRSEERQRELFEARFEDFVQDGYSPAEALDATSVLILPPGCSESQTGLAVSIVTPNYQVLDAGYARYPAAQWLAENSWKYGFILRYPEGKEEITGIAYMPWHMRYVGEEHATAIFESGLCLEEYLDTVL